MEPKYPLTEMEERAIGAASVAMHGFPDAVRLLNELCHWDDPPLAEKRWEEKVAAACEIAVAFCKMANNKKEEIKKLQEAIEDTLCDTEVIKLHPNTIKKLQIVRGHVPGRLLTEEEHKYHIDKLLVELKEMRDVIVDLFSEDTNSKIDNLCQSEKTLDVIKKILASSDYFSK